MSSRNKGKAFSVEAEGCRNSDHFSRALCCSQTLGLLFNVMGWLINSALLTVIGVILKQQVILLHHKHYSRE